MKSAAVTRIAFGVLAIVLITFAIYLPILPGTFLMDDARLTGSDNALVNGQLTLRTLWFGTDFTLATFGWWLEHLAFGTNPAGYHVVNIALQAVSGILLWQLLRQLKIPGAWLAGMLFAVHPVCVNSVARIGELKNTLSMPFLQFSFIAYLRYESVRLYPVSTSPESSAPKATAWYVISFVAFVLAMMAKTTAVMLPAVILLCAWWQRKKIQWKDHAHTLPFFVLALAFGLMSVWFQKNQALLTTPLVLHPASFAERLAGVGYRFWFYLGKDLWPGNITIEYPRWTVHTSVVGFLPDLFLSILIVACLCFRRTWGRHALFGLGGFLVLLFPALGFFDAQFEALWQVSDHLQYTALAAIVALVAPCIAAVPNATTFRLMATILVTGFSLTSFKRAGVFTSEERLMTDTVFKNPAGWGAHNDLGVIFAERGDYPEALHHFALSLQYNPENVDARLNMGYALVLQHKYDEARNQYLAALQIDPRSAMAHKMYARLLELEGKNTEALHHLRLSSIFNPDADIFMEMSSLDYTADNARGVVDDLRRALALKPKFEDKVAALNNLAWILATCPDASVRDGKQAIAYAQEDCQLTAFRQPRFLTTLATAYAEAGRFEDAIQTVQEAIKAEEASGDRPGVESSQQLLQLFKAGQPVRDKLPGK